MMVAECREEGAGLTPSSHLTIPVLSQGECWYVVHTHSGKELWAVRNLARQGFKSFVPRLGMPGVGNREVLLFPGYIFTAFDRNRHRWRSINSSFGVKYLVSFSEYPAPVPLGVVEGLLQMFGKSTHQFETGRNGLAEGDEVIITSGPFAHNTGRILSLTSGERVKLLLASMANGLPIVAPISALRRFDPREH